MADLIAVLRASAVSISTSALTLLQITAAAQQRVKLKEVGITFAGTVNTNAPVLVQLMVQTTAGTPGSTPTPVKTDGDMQETVQTTGAIGFSAEPTYGAVLREWYVHPQSGVIVPLPLGRPPVLKGGTRCGLVVTAANAVTGSAYVEFEE